MESFILTCTTCKSRLKVRDTGVVGQIMACPKCGGMVLIKPPEAGASAQAAKPASETGETKPDLSNPLRPLPPLDPATPLKADAFDDIDVLLGDVPPRNMVPAPTVRATSPHAAPANTAPLMKAPLGTNSIIKPPDSKNATDSQAQTLSQNDIPAPQPTPLKTVSPPATPAKPAETVQRTAAAAAAAAVPQVFNNQPAVANSPGHAVKEAVAEPAAATPAAAAGTLAGSPWQYWALVSASGLLGVLLAVGVVAITISWFSNSTQPITPPIAQVNPPAQAAVTEPNPVPPIAPPVPSNPAVPPNAVAVAPTPTPSVEPVVEPVVPPPLPAEAPQNPPAPMPPAERDPLGLTEPPPAVKPTLPNNDPFQKFGEILGGSPTDPTPPAPAPAVEPPPPVVEEEPNPSPTSAKLPKPEPRHIDLAARLADPLPAIEISNSPLADFLQVMQGLSTVPITLRPDGLGMVRITPFNSETPVSWKGSSTTVLDAIQGALQPLGLEAKLEADQLIVDVASPQLMTTKLAVKDLTGSDERRAAEIAALLLTFVAHDSWGDEDGQPILSATKDELTVRQHRAQLAECFLLVEKLRIARGLPLASKFEPKLFELATRSEKAHAVLAAPITLNYSIPTPLLRVTERLGKDAKVRILFDWQSLTAVGWNPDAEVTLTVEKQPLSTALTDLTRRMDLTWRIVDARTIQILSPQTLADRTELEFYSVEGLAENDASAAILMAKIRTALGGQAFRDAGGRGELRFDATGKCLLAALTQPQQQEVAKLLRSYREAAAAAK